MNLSFILAISMQAAAVGDNVPLDQESFERLVYNSSPVGSDVLPNHEDPTALPRWKAQLAQFKDANERLLKLVNRDYSVTRESQSLLLSLFALYTREDLTPEQLDRFTGILGGMAAPNREWTELEKQFICGALPVLQHYPSPKHETLAVRFAGDADVVIALSAVNTLTMIGTKNSLAAAQNAMKRRYARFPRATDYTTKLLEAAVDKIEKRVASLESTTNPPAVTKPIAVPKTADQVSSGTHLQSATNEVLHFRWIVWAAVALSTIGLLWLMLKKRRL